MYECSVVFINIKMIINYKSVSLCSIWVTSYAHRNRVTFIIYRLYIANL